MIERTCSRYHREVTFTENGFQFGAQGVKGLVGRHGPAGLAIARHFLDHRRGRLVQNGLIVEVGENFVIGDDGQLR